MAFGASRLSAGEEVLANKPATLRQAAGIEHRRLSGRCSSYPKKRIGVPRSALKRGDDRPYFYTHESAPIRVK
jgi:hypothetical protein